MHVLRPSRLRGIDQCVSAQGGLKSITSLRIREANEDIKFSLQTLECVRREFMTSIS